MLLEYLISLNNGDVILCQLFIFFGQLNNIISEPGMLSLVVLQKILNSQFGDIEVGIMLKINPALFIRMQVSLRDEKALGHLHLPDALVEYGLVLHAFLDWPAGWHLLSIIRLCRWQRLELVLPLSYFI